MVLGCEFGDVSEKILQQGTTEKRQPGQIQNARYQLKTEIAHSPERIALALELYPLCIIDQNEIRNPIREYCQECYDNYQCQNVDHDKLNEYLADRFLLEQDEHRWKHEADALGKVVAELYETLLLTKPVTPDEMQHELLFGDASPHVEIRDAKKRYDEKLFEKPNCRPPLLIQMRGNPWYDYTDGQ